eukprot:TRINITY_DN3148_c0_g1_i1.p2 TRINITY_DN3148_c0_g1~~TRINITY_DN3148_c0_g1_i1.p2  ORF type:complete len:65 (-),score=2.49 TRINITY_DN3148_c0_g1_i1:29-223(-)
MLHLHGTISLHKGSDVHTAEEIDIYHYRALCYKRNSRFRDGASAQIVEIGIPRMCGTIDGKSDA